MPINRLSSGQSVGHSSRLTSATISSSAKCKPEMNAIISSSDVIMKSTTNLTRTRSLRLPSRSRDHNYLMSGQLISNTNKDINTNNDSNHLTKSCSLSRHSSIRHSSDSSSSLQSSTLEVSLNSMKSNINKDKNATTRSTKATTNSIGIKDALIPKFVRNSFGKLSKNMRPNQSKDDTFVDKCGKRDSHQDFRRQGSIVSNSLNESYLKINELRSPNVCPSSPVSNSSRDSGILGINGSNCSQNCLNHLRKLAEEHERLQIEYSRVRQQFIEMSANVANRHSDHSNEVMPQNMEIEIQKERSLAKSYKSEVNRLQEELKRLQRKYWDNVINGKLLLTNCNNNNTSTNGSEAEFNLSDLQNINVQESEEQINNTILTEKIESLRTIVKELEYEIKEAKENNEFLTSERTVLAEALKETEETLFKERLLSIKERETYEEMKKQNEDLKHEINEIANENIQFKRDLLTTELSLKEKNTLIECLKSEQELNQKKLINLNNELDVLTEKYRCHQSVNKEYKNMMDESNDDSISNENIHSLRLEMVSLKESLAMKDDMIEKLGAKYTRNRKVWEENDRKATQEIKKLDDIIDHVIDTLKSLPENLRISEPIQDIIELLTEGSVSEHK